MVPLGRIQADVTVDTQSFFSYCVVPRYYLLRLWIKRNKLGFIHYYAAGVGPKFKILEMLVKKLYQNRGRLIIKYELNENVVIKKRWNPGL